MKNTGKTYYFGERLINQIVCVCKDCHLIFYCNDGMMVMLRDDLWQKICDNFSDTICVNCIEKRLNRTIENEDYKNVKTPCNQFHINAAVTNVVKVLV
jgi:uncharacterized protein YbaR (Trm112 family)